MTRYRDIDFFRGLMLVIMTINHIGCGFLLRVTYQPLGYVTAAEGFVFLSGLTIGLLFRVNPRARERFLSYAWAWKRVRLIYLYYLGAFAVLAGGLFFFPGLGERWAYYIPLFHEHPAEAVLLGITLLKQPYYLNILPLYLGITLLTPPALRQVRNGRVRQLILVSILFWLLAQAIMNKFLLFRMFHIGTLDIGFFNIFAWQFLYLAGMLIGIFWDRLRKAAVVTDRKMLLLSLLLSIFFFLYKHEFIRFKIFFLGYFIKIPTLGIFRLLNFFALFHLTVFFRDRLRPLFHNRFLELLGRHSLQVFTAHFFILLGLQIVKYDIKSLGLAGELGFTAVGVGLLGIVALGHGRIIRGAGGRRLQSEKR